MISNWLLPHDILTSIATGTFITANDSLSLKNVLISSSSGDSLLKGEVYINLLIIAYHELIKKEVEGVRDAHNRTFKSESLDNFRVVAGLTRLLYKQVLTMSRSLIYNVEARLISLSGPFEPT